MNVYILPLTCHFIHATPASINHREIKKTLNIKKGGGVKGDLGTWRYSSVELEHF